MTEILLGTRGSELALAQTVLTTTALQAAWPRLRIRREIIRTAGDLRPDLRLADFSRGDSPVVDKGIFTKELENALRAGSIHAAVHSLKDVPTLLDPGFRISAVLPRAPIEDMLISKTPGGLDALPAGSVIATSSVRRIRLLRHLRPDLQTVEIRGNVHTRLRKAAENPEIHALVLARAGLRRLGLEQETLTEFGTALHPVRLDPARFLPAASQGAVALETFEETPELAALLAAISDGPTFTRITAERRFLELLQAGCQTPVGIHSSLENGWLTLRALVFPEESSASSGPRSAVRNLTPAGTPLEAVITAPAGNPLEAARLLFDRLRPAG